ncbi:hypothetical protein JAAARDRAFT_195710 [Jaapia argillacea MUCL 33604]|uniref:Uncharacterized protein n=1 Tax=Jaapia argillacea MUCL 33604 TaxID=933084 RepID=A0A067PY95_9AGAM|nr:hypothetical protein JAAARDRAFT_195710 [Jaapia argillacea MUCL 33604]
MQVRGEMEVPVRVIVPDSYSNRIDFSNFPPITEAHIQDRSKRDAISKGLVLVQTTWFILQCLGRAINRLPITKLEIATLAFTVLNLATYWFWWNKPADVRYPYTTPTVHGGEVFEGGGEAENGAKDYDEGGNGFVQVATRFKSRIRAAFSLAWTYAETEPPLRRVFIVPFYLLGTTFLNPFLSPKIRPPDLRVPTFYAGNLENGEGILVAWISALIASVFGAIHCFAWSLQFPSHKQQLMWRVSAVTTSSAPLLLVSAFRLSIVQRYFSVCGNFLGLGVAFSHNGYMCYVCDRTHYTTGPRIYIASLSPSWGIRDCLLDDIHPSSVVALTSSILNRAVSSSNLITLFVVSRSVLYIICVRRFTIHILND